MAGEGIFLETPSGLRLLQEQPYDREDILQRALEDYPEVMAGVSTSSGERAKLALVRREAPVPSQEGGSQTWSLDHLFVDADAVPVLVEVKRSSDTRIRREVVGQMLDYAANGPKYWPIADLRQAFEARHATPEMDADAWLLEHFSADNADDFWKDVEANLRSGHVRLVFVADNLPRELIRIIEFLNEQMSEAEVLGIELRQYVGDGDQRAFVPAVIGRTSRAVEAKKVGGGGERWDLDSFMAAAKARRTAEEVAFIERLFQHVEQRGGEYRWGTGVTPGMSGWYRIEGEPRPVFNLNVNAEAPGRQAYLSFYLSDLEKKVSHERLEKALSILETIPAFAQPVADARAANYVKWPTAFLPAIIGHSQALETLVAAIDVLVDTK